MAILEGIGGTASSTTTTAPRQRDIKPAESGSVVFNAPVGGGSGSSTSAFNQSISVAREQVGLGKRTGLRTIAQALTATKNAFARGTRDIALGVEGGTLKHEDVLRRIEEGRVNARTQLDTGLRKIQESVADRGRERTTGLRNIEEFAEEETERVTDAAEARGLSRSGIQLEDVEEVAEDAQESTFDLNASIDSLLNALQGDEKDLRTTVKNLLTQLKGDETAANSEFKLLLEGFQNLESDLEADFTLGKIDAAQDKDELLEEVRLALKALDARQAGGTGGGGLTGTQLLDAFIASQNRN